MLECVIAASMLKAHDKGDMMTLEAIMSRAVGKVKEEIDQTTRTDDSVVKGVPTAKLLELVNEDPDKKMA